MLARSSSEAPILISALTRSYGKRRGIVDVSLAVHEGEIFGFLGPNGAGKTTTIRVLIGLLRPSAGSAQVFGLDCWSSRSEVKGKVGYLPGELHLYETMTGNQFLDFFAGFRPRVPHQRHHELAQRLDLDLRPKIKHLSKGNRQKLALIQALMHDAPLLLLDEPSSGLDPFMQIELLTILQEERSRGKTIFLSSHVLSEVERVADRVGIVREGRLVTVEEVERLRQMRERVIEATFHAPVDRDIFSRLDGVTVMAWEQGDCHVHLRVRGPLPPLLRVLGNLPVDDLTASPPDLESIFMHLYSEPASSQRELLDVGR